MKYLFFAALVLTGCTGKPVTPDDVTAVLASERPVSASVTLAGRKHACSSGQAMWAALTASDQTNSRWQGIAEACDVLLSMVGPYIPVSGKTYPSERAQMCGEMPESTPGGHSLAYADVRGLIGCGS